MAGDFVPKCITIRKDQEDWVDSQRKVFKLSKFIQNKLDEYKKEIDNFRREE